MKTSSILRSRALSFLYILLIALDAPPCAKADPPAGAVNSFQTYTRTLEDRLDRRHRSADNFLATGTSTPEELADLRRGDLLIQHLETPAVQGALLHHWRGTAFAPGAVAADFERLLRDYSAYPQRFAPQVLRAAATRPDPDHYLASMRVRQHHVITVVMDSSYDVAFGRLDARHGYSISQSTRIAEVDSAGTSSERTLAVAEDHGFLWRLNTYWSWEERDGGLYLQVEAVSLTRAVPRGLGWAIRPYVESIPRESLEFTLRSARNALVK